MYICILCVCVCVCVFEFFPVPPACFLSLLPLLLHPTPFCCLCARAARVSGKLGAMQY